MPAGLPHHKNIASGTGGPPLRPLPRPGAWGAEVPAASRLPQRVPLPPRFWELGSFPGGEHRGGAGGAAGARAAGPGGAERGAGEPLAERPLCPALPDAGPPSAARLRAHRTRLHPELHPGAIRGREGTGRRVPRSRLPVVGAKGSGLTWRTHDPPPQSGRRRWCLGRIS